MNATNKKGLPNKTRASALPASALVFCVLLIALVSPSALAQSDSAGTASQDTQAPLDVALPFELGRLRMSVGMDYLRPGEGPLLDGANLNGLTEGDPGVDMNVALDAGFLGELAVGFRVRQAGQSTVVDVLSSNEYKPATSVGVGWSKGQFSGQLDAHQNPLDRTEAERALIDIDFAWRTPWQGTISLGARNIFDARQQSDSLASENQSFDELFGRMPYVRYQHDL